MTDRRIMSIHDDQVGEGVHLAFPSMSSCSAIVLLLDTTLVGVHKTMGWTPTHGTIMGYALELVRGRDINALYIGGWDMGHKHDPAQIRQTLGCDNVPTYTADYKTGEQTLTKPWGDITRDVFKAHIGSARTSDVCTFAVFLAPDTAPRIGLKRTTKVGVVQDPGAPARMKRIYGDLRGQRMASVETITTPSDHLHQIHFQPLH